MKRAVVFLLTLTLSLSALGCGGSKTESDTTEKKATESAEIKKDETKNESNAQSESVDTSFISVLDSFGNYEPSIVTGAGDSVIDIPNAGLPCLITLSYSGSSNFAVWSVDSAGNNVDLLVNEIGVYNGVVTTYFDFKDATMLSVSASGDWSITFSPLSHMPQAANGSVFSGDSVVYIDEPTMTKVSFSHEGDSNFVVKAVGMNSNKLLVNEIGLYSGTVIWNEPQAFFVVTANGPWSISW